MMACLDKMCHIILPSCSGLKRQKEAKPDTYTKKIVVFLFNENGTRSIHQWNTWHRSWTILHSYPFFLSVALPSCKISRDLECNLQFNAINWGLLPLSHVQFRFRNVEMEKTVLQRKREPKLRLFLPPMIQIMDDVVTVGVVLLRFCQHSQTATNSLHGLAYYYPPKTFFFLCPLSPMPHTSVHTLKISTLSNRPMRRHSRFS